jgi:uncharacterized protein YndB with AHSA1/START domain
MTPGTVHFHRVLRAPASRVYRAFLEPDAFAHWLPPHGFVATTHRLEPAVGGSWRMSFRQFATGHVHAFGGEYLELVPHTRIVYTSRFDDPGLPGTMRTTVRLTEVSCGTDLAIVQEGIPAVIPLEMCVLGWQESLGQLARMVEGPDGAPG